MAAAVGSGRGGFPAPDQPDNRQALSRHQRHPVDEPGPCRSTLADLQAGRRCRRAGAQGRARHGHPVLEVQRGADPDRRERQARPRCPGQAGQSGSAAGTAAGVLRHRLQRRADRRSAADATQGTDLGRRRARRSHPAGVRRRDPARGAEPRLLPLADRQHPSTRQGPVSQRRQLLRDRTARTRALDWPPVTSGP
ncbi:MAG: hypothetical protein AW10_03368 [Candidatus Accumulibacter appositus]|uniref:Uncharacterized protein n=1 Tax=Candidatus Accumulibacter appositus TaxID=1454003 RepID=A0A011QGP6_9PROT|nr:MAG: hypothetical protein AW10_03368 [Candidatus Accumulibacter appositus]